MQELRDQLANLHVTAADKYDPARVIQELRCIRIKLGAFGDVVVSVRRTHAWFTGTP